MTWFLTALLIPALTLFALPALVWSASRWQTRERGWRLAVVYLSTLLVFSLLLPIFTGRARWESEIYDLETLRSTSYAGWVILGVLGLRSLTALAEGLLVASLARRPALSSVFAIGIAFPVAIECTTLITWLYEWCPVLVRALLTGPARPEAAEPLSVAVRVGLSYLAPPILAGTVTVVAATWRRLLMSRGGGFETRPCSS